MARFFQIPLDLPHAGKIAWRIHSRLAGLEQSDRPEHRAVLRLVKQLREILEPYRDSGENPDEETAQGIVLRVAALARELVDAIEQNALGEDRLGECVRNLFECLELGEEGVTISLRAGENPGSPLRP